MAGINQQHNKDMFDYTGFQAQVAQMKAAGLNPALMYGSAGGGGSTQGGAGMAGGAGAGSGSVGGTPSAPDTGITAGIGMGCIEAIRIIPILNFVVFSIYWEQSPDHLKIIMV